MHTTPSPQPLRNTEMLDLGAALGSDSVHDRPSHHSSILYCRRCPQYSIAQDTAQRRALQKQDGTGSQSRPRDKSQRASGAVARQRITLLPPALTMPAGNISMCSSPHVLPANSPPTLVDILEDASGFHLLRLDSSTGFFNCRGFGR